jgi:hypothetical protein
MDVNIRIYRLSNGRRTDQWKWYSRSRLKYQLYGPYHTPRTVCLSWYCPPYQYLLCLLHWGPESETHNIHVNAQEFFKESRNLIENTILGINKTLQTDKWIFECTFNQDHWRCFKVSICACSDIDIDRSISASRSVSQNSEVHMESVQPIKCMLCILICNI